MKAHPVSFWEWQQLYPDTKTCLKAIMKLRWPHGFQCRHCGENHGWLIESRHSFECAHCHRQQSILAGTLFEHTKLPLPKWFWSLYLMASDKGSISALRLSKLIGVSWRTAFHLLRKIRIAMGDQGQLYRLQGLIELDDALVGGKRSGKRGRGAAGKTSIIVACEHNDGRPGFVALEAVKAVNHTTVKRFCEKHLRLQQSVKTDALPALTALSEEHHHIARITPPEQASTWLPWVHIVISNFKAYLLGTYHGVSGKYLQEYLNEFSYRMNRRFWEPEIPNRLLRICVNHVPVKIQPALCA